MNRTKERDEALREEALTDLLAHVEQIAWLAEASYKKANEERWEEAHQMLVKAETDLKICLDITRG